VLESEMVDALLEEIDAWEKEEAARGTLKRDASPSLGEGRMRLPVLN
jgi:hypothetical protein